MSLKRTCLVTGANGLVGRALVPLLDEYEVLSLDRHRADLTQADWTDQLPDRMDTIVHLAQSDRYRDFPEGAADVFGVNVMGCLRLLDYARTSGAKKVVLASSGVVYGSGSGVFSEENSLIVGENQLGLYYTSKLCAEAIAENYTKFFDVVILRFFFVYGPGQKEYMLMPRLVRSVREGKSIALQGQDGLTINPIHVNDAARAVSSAMEIQGSHRINVAGPDQISLRSIGEAIGSAAGRAPVFEVSPEATSPEMVGSIDRMCELLGAPRTPFEEGIQSCLPLTTQ